MKIVCTEYCMYNILRMFAELGCAGPAWPASTGQTEKKNWFRTPQARQSSSRAKMNPAYWFPRTRGSNELGHGGGRTDRVRSMVVCQPLGFFSSPRRVVWVSSFALWRSCLFPLHLLILFSETMALLGAPGQYEESTSGRPRGTRRCTPGET